MDGWEGKGGSEMRLEKMNSERKVRHRNEMRYGKVSEDNGRKRMSQDEMNDKIVLCLKWDKF